MERFGQKCVHAVKRLLSQTGKRNLKGIPTIIIVIVIIILHKHLSNTDHLVNGGLLLIYRKIFLKKDWK